MKCLVCEVCLSQAGGMGAYPAALKLYEDIHRSHPNDIECVRYLITICKEMKLKYDPGLQLALLPIVCFFFSRSADLLRSVDSAAFAV